MTVNILGDQVIEIGEAGKTALTDDELKSLGASEEHATSASREPADKPGLLAALGEWLGGLFS